MQMKYKGRNVQKEKLKNKKNYCSSSAKRKVYPAYWLHDIAK
jgi:hypothetical protein